MSLYDNAFPSNYEEIRTFYPVWYFDVKEMDAVWRTTGKQLDGVQAGVDAIIANNFIATADEVTIGALENFLLLPSSPTRPLQDRRQLVASFFLDGGTHIGSPEIKEIMTAFTDAPTNVDFNDGTITVRINKDINNTFTEKDCYSVLSRKIPAHLDLLIQVISPISGPAYRAIFMTAYREEEIA